VSSIVIEDKVIAVFAWTVSLGVKSIYKHCLLNDKYTKIQPLLFVLSVHGQETYTVLFLQLHASYVVQKP